MTAIELNIERDTLLRQLNTRIGEVDAAYAVKAMKQALNMLNKHGSKATAISNWNTISDKELYRMLDRIEHEFDNGGGIPDEQIDAILCER